MKRTTRLTAILILLIAVPSTKGATPARTILVFPFTNLSNRSDLNWISEGFAALMSSRLASENRYVLGREERNAAYAQLELAPKTPLTLASSYKVAEILGVDWAVVGEFNVVGKNLTASAQLLDARNLKLSSSIEAGGDLTDFVDVATRLAWRLLGAHDANFVVGSEDDFRRRFPDVRLDAFENYIRGMLSTDEANRVRFLTESDRRNPLDHQAAFQLGRYYFDQKDYVKAEVWLTKLQARDSNYLESLFLLGVSEYFLGHSGAAERAFETVSRQIPLNEVSNDLGVMEAGRRDYAEALAKFERAYQTDPSDPDFSYNAGVCLWYLKRYPEGVKFLKESLGLDNEDVGAHTLLGLMLGKLGDTEGQRRQWEWLATREGNVMTKDSEEDIQPQARIKKHYDGRAFRLLALAVYNAEEASLDRRPPAEHGEVHLANGKKLLAEGRLQEAESDLKEAVSLLPNDSEAHLALGEVLDAEGKHSPAAAELESSLKLKESVDAHAFLAKAYLALDRIDAARHEGQMALQMDPNNREAAGVIDQITSRGARARRLR